LDLARPSPLLLRVLSALVLAPIVLAAVWFGAPWLPLLTLFAVAAMGWEWARLCAGGRFGIAGLIMVASGVAAVAALSMGTPWGAVLAALIGAAGVFAVAAATRFADPLWAAGGTLWIALGTVAFLWLALRPGEGRGTALWLLAVVWATDTGAYAAGRAIGGPRLAPRLSPNKTWAGLAGGVACAGIVGLVAARLAGGPAAAIVVVSLALAVVSQLGDLAESLAKRHFGVKDASGLIPGHGGLLDRLDGMLAAAAAAGVLALAAGNGPFIWR
jgi:phosphatidate cytidylyltransferase